jgi:hypothetical protein
MLITFLKDFMCPKWWYKMVLMFLMVYFAPTLMVVDLVVFCGMVKGLVWDEAGERGVHF